MADYSMQDNQPPQYEDLGNGVKRRYVGNQTVNNGWGDYQVPRYEYQTPDGQVLQDSEYQSWITQSNEAKKEADRIAALKAQGLNPDGSPIRPDWNTLINPETGQMDAKYVLDPSKIDTLNKYRTEALRTGPSAWANLQTQNQGIEEQNAKSAAARQAQSGYTSALSQLAMRGGAASGTRANLARQSMKDLLSSRQQVNRAGITNRLGIQSTDEQNRIDQLGKAAEADTKIGQYNLENVLKEIEGKRGFDQGVYQEQMKKYASDKQAEATRRSGGGGGK